MVASPQAAHAAENDTSDGCPQGQIRGGGGGTTTPNRNKCYSKAGQSGGVPNYHEEGDVDPTRINRGEPVAPGGNHGEPTTQGNDGATYDNSVKDSVDIVCQEVETNTDKHDDCVRNIQDAYNTCKDDPHQNTNSELLANCIADATGYDAVILGNLFYDENSGKDPAKSACKIEDGIGWIICPAFGFLAKATDGIYTFLSYFLRYDSIQAEQKKASEGHTNTPSAGCVGADQPIECAWSQMRNLANIVFVIMFVAIIYSQATGFGFSNYNIKRMLPRLIVAAILVNISYWLCALAVDISNVVGANIYDFLVSLVAQRGGGGGQTTQFTPDFAKIMVGVLAGTTLIAGLAVAGALLATLAFLLPIMLSALCAALVVIAILIGRQMMISILIVAAPIALVLYLLPNTAKWFDKWKDLFISMLLLYPLIGLVFGGATFAANVIRISDNGLFLKLFALAIQTVPLFIIPTILASTGGMLGKIGAMTNDKTKGVFDRTNNRAQSLIRRRQAAGATKYFNRRANKTPPTSRAGRAWAKTGGKAWGNARAGTMGRQMNRDQGYADNENALNTARAGMNNTKKQDESYAKYLAGGDADLAKQITAQGTLAAREQEERDASGLGNIMAKKEEEELVNILHNKGNDHSQEEVAAALQQLIKTGEAEGANGYGQFIDRYQAEARASGANKTGGTVVTRATASALQGSAYLGGGAMNSIANGNSASFRGTVEGELTKGISGEKLAGANTSETKFMHSIAGGNAQVATNLGGAARAVQGDAKLNGQVGATRSHISTFSTYH